MTSNRLSNYLREMRIKIRVQELIRIYKDVIQDEYKDVLQDSKLK